MQNKDLSFEKERIIKGYFIDLVFFMVLTTAPPSPSRGGRNYARNKNFASLHLLPYEPILVVLKLLNETNSFSRKSTYYYRYIKLYFIVIK